MCIHRTSKEGCGKIFFMKKSFFIIFSILLIHLPLFADTCVTYKNMSSSPLSGELFEVRGTMFWDHGDIINHYFFLLDKNTCFSTEYGDWDIKQVQVILSKEQLKKIDQITNKEITMEIESWMVGETQSWKTRIGVLKAKFRFE